MTEAEIVAALEVTEIRMEEDVVVPINGQTVPLPYMVIRRVENIAPSDNGAVAVITIEWNVALFSTNRNSILESRILKALLPAGVYISVERYPDGAPYQTSFIFTTKQPL